MYRGTTPTHVFRDIGIDLREARVYVTYSQNKKVVLEKTNEDMKINENLISLKLTQSDTLKFKEGIVQVQMRYVMKDGTADASGICNCPANRILKEGVIEWA